MNQRSFLKLFATVLSLAILSAACGDSGGGSTGTPTGGAVVESEDTTTTSQISLGNSGPVIAYTFDLYVIDRETGANAAIEVPTKFVDGNFEPATDGETAYAIGFEPVEGQNFTQVVSIIKVDLATNRSEIFLELGQNIENDESQEVVLFGPIVLAGGDPWVVRDDTTAEFKVLERYDAQSGKLLAEIPLELSGKIVSDDTNLYVVGYEGINKIDLATNTLSLMQSEEITLEDFDPELDLAPYIFTKSGNPLPEEHRDFFMGFNIDVSDFNTIATGGDRFWFIMSQFGISFDDESAIAEAIVEYDPVTESVVALHPLNGLGGRFLPEEETYDVSTITQAKLIFRDGYLFIADARENGKLLRLDPATGLVTESYDPFSPDYDWFDFELIETDPDALWLLVSQATITEEDVEAGTRSSSIEKFMVRIDPITGEEVVSVPQMDLYLFGT